MRFSIIGILISLSALYSCEDQIVPEKHCTDPEAVDYYGNVFEDNEGNCQFLRTFVLGNYSGFSAWDSTYATFQVEKTEESNNSIRVINLPLQGIVLTGFVSGFDHHQTQYSRFIWINDQVITTDPDTVTISGHGLCSNGKIDFQLQQKMGNDSVGYYFISEKIP